MAKPFDPRELLARVKSVLRRMQARPHEAAAAAAACATAAATPAGAGAAPGRLRRKIEPDSVAEPRCFRTVRNAGYMYVPLAG